jgi:uracil-DNA glycosylase
MSLFNNSWDDILKKEIESPYFIELGIHLKKQRELGKTIFPESKNYFKALKETDFYDVKVVLVGQDCYFNGEADGLAFSVSDEKFVACPKSLRLILDAIEESIYNGFKVDQDWNLERWAKQGVLLLNRVLSIEKGKPASHYFIGWEQFTEAVISSLNMRDDIVFILLGKKAQELEKFISPKSIVLKAEHPAAAGYNNRKWEYNDVFKKCNEILEQNGKDKILW